MAIYRCPHCHQAIEITITRHEPSWPAPFAVGGGQRTQTMADSVKRPPWMGDVAPPLEPSPTFRSARRSIPTRAPEQTDWQVPLAQATFTGLLVGFPAGVGLAIWQGWPWLLCGGVGFVVSMAGVWLWRLRAYHSLLMRVEEVIGADLTGDGQVGPPPAAPPLRVELEHRGSREGWQFANLPTSKSKERAGLIAFAGAILSDHASFSERDAAGWGGYSRKEWELLRDEFLESGWAVWNNEEVPQQGITLLRAGRAVLRQIAAYSV